VQPRAQATSLATSDDEPIVEPIVTPYRKRVRHKEALPSE